MDSKVSEKDMREVYFQAFGKEYDSADRKQAPLPLEIAYLTALNKLKREGKYAGGGEITDDNYFQSVNHFVYFCMNYPNNFLDAFGSLKTHLSNKFKNYYNKYGTYGVMIQFYAELDSENRRILTDYSLKNYKGTPISSDVSEVEYFNSVNHFIFFCFNFPSNFMDAFSSHLKVHLSSKWTNAYEKKGSIGAMIYFWSELDNQNRRKLADWVKKNYTGTKLYEVGGALGDVTGMLPSPLPMSTIQAMAKGGQLEFGGGVDDFKMSYDEMTTYEKSNHIHYNPMNSRWEVTKNGENKEFWNQEQAEKYAGFEFDNDKDSRYSRKKYEALFGYAKGGGVDEKEIYYIDWTNKEPKLSELKKKYLLDSISFSFDKDDVVRDAINKRHIYHLVIIKGNMGYDAFKYNPDTFNPLDFGGIKMFADGGGVDVVWIALSKTKNGLLLSERFDKQITHKQLFDFYKKMGYEIIDSNIFKVTNKGALDVFKDAISKFIKEKYNELVDWENSLLSYEIVGDRIIAQSCFVQTKNGNEYKITPNDLLNKKFNDGGGVDIDLEDDFKKALVTSNFTYYTDNSDGIRMFRNSDKEELTDSAFAENSLSEDIENNDIVWASDDMQYNIDAMREEFSKGGSTKVYKYGGEIEERVKEKLSRNFALPFEVVVYVPSTQDADKTVSKEEFMGRITEVETYLAKLFGGFSANPVDGGYNSDEKGLITEDVFKVYSFASRDGFEPKMEKLVVQIKDWCKTWGQEAIGLEFEGDLFYVEA